MPYRRRRRKRSGYRKPTSKSQDVQINLSKLWKNVKYVKSLINVERKFLDTAVNTSPNTTASINALSSLVQGDGSSGRDGESVRATALHGQLHCTMHASATHTRLRAIIFSWNNDSTPIAADILMSTTEPISLLQPNSGMFSVLKDFSFSISDTSHEQYQRKYYIPLSKKLIYNDTSSASFTKNSLWMLLLSSEATNAPTFKSQHRLVFVDN